MLIRNALFKVEQILRNRIEVEILLADCLGISREQIFLHPELRIDEGKFKKFYKNCTFRARGIPIAYLIHHKEFFGLDFYVDERVLIPRPETEILVEEIISFDTLRMTLPRPSICDIGTGSGCIAIALAKNIQGAKITAVDISGNALKVARKNAKIHDVSDKIEFVKSDLLEKVLDRHFDIIVANLPYISEDEKYLVDKEVLEFEPSRALFAGKKGLDFFEKLFKQISTLNPQPSTLICEVGFNQRTAIEKFIKRYFGNVNVEWKRDLAGFDRVFILNY